MEKMTGDSSMVTTGTNHWDPPRISTQRARMSRDRRAQQTMQQGGVRARRAEPASGNIFASNTRRASGGASVGGGTASTGAEGFAQVLGAGGLTVTPTRNAVGLGHWPKELKSAGGSQTVVEKAKMVNTANDKMLNKLYGCCGGREKPKGKMGSVMAVGS